MNATTRRIFPYLMLLLILSALGWAVSFGTLPKADFTFNNGTEIQTVDPAKATGSPEGRIINAVRERATELEAEDQDVELLVQRLRITGRTSQCRGVSQLEDKLRHDIEIVGPEERVTAVIESVTNDTQPPIDLTSLADRTDLLGQLAGLILTIDRPNHEDDEGLQQQDVSAVSAGA